MRQSIIVIIPFGKSSQDVYRSTETEMPLPAPVRQLKPLFIIIVFRSWSMIIINST